MPEAMKLVESVKEYRSKSKRKQTRKAAQTPTRFYIENIPDSDYLVVPEVSSERRPFIPIGYLSSDHIPSNLVKVIADGSLYHLGVLSSTMHMAWMRYVAGRLKSDYRYSVRIVYNNFPWPKPDGKKRKGVANAAEGVVSARAPYLEDGATMADLYDPLTMPPDLVKAHERLDKAVDLAYRPQPFTTEINRVRFLFERYAEITAED